jgi:hypothetical protein
MDRLAEVAPGGGHRPLLHRRPPRRPHPRDLPQAFPGGGGTPSWPSTSPFPGTSTPGSATSPRSSSTTWTTSAGSWRTTFGSAPEPCPRGADHPPPLRRLPELVRLARGGPGHSHHAGAGRGPPPGGAGPALPRNGHLSPEDRARVEAFQPPPPEQAPPRTHRPAAEGAGDGEGPSSWTPCASSTGWMRGAWTPDSSTPGVRGRRASAAGGTGPPGLPLTGAEARGGLPLPPPSAHIEPGSPRKRSPTTRRPCRTHPQPIRR